MDGRISSRRVRCRFHRRNLWWSWKMIGRKPRPLLVLKSAFCFISIYDCCWFFAVLTIADCFLLYGTERNGSGNLRSLYGLLRRLTFTIFFSFSAVNSWTVLRTPFKRSMSLWGQPHLKSKISSDRFCGFWFFGLSVFWCNLSIVGIMLWGGHFSRLIWGKPVPLVAV